MGGQACVFYGGAEFSRDTDFAVLTAPENIVRLDRALAELQAERIAVPPYEVALLERGHAVHFRCRHPEAAGLRIDLMARMRGVADFATLWERRTTLEDAATGERFELLSLPDLVQAKKTQRDKDWPMIRRLIEAHYLAHQNDPTPEQIAFWLLEARTPEILCEVAAAHPEHLAAGQLRRPALAALPDPPALSLALEAEERATRAEDARYWIPLKAELEAFRRAERQPPA